MAEAKKETRGQYWLGKKRPPMSNAQKLKLRNFNLDKKHSEITKEKIRQKAILNGFGKERKGKPAWNIGKKMPEISGKNHYLWKGGESRGYKTGYYSTEYKNWRISVFERDGYRCQVCGIVGGYLTAHHIKSFAHFPELRFDINNGITLCEECHKKTDNYKGRNKTKITK